MSVIIRGMQMQKKCIRCPVNVYGRCLVNDDKDVSKATADAVRDKDCPLVPVPDHGRLIDADEIIKDDHQHYDYLSDSFYVTVRDIELAPTVIEAEEASA